MNNCKLNNTLVLFNQLDTGAIQNYFAESTRDKVIAASESNELRTAALHCCLSLSEILNCLITSSIINSSNYIKLKRSLHILAS